MSFSLVTPLRSWRDHSLFTTNSWWRSVAEEEPPRNKWWLTNLLGFRCSGSISHSLSRPTLGGTVKNQVSHQALSSNARVSCRTSTSFKSRGWSSSKSKRWARRCWKKRRARSRKAEYKQNNPLMPPRCSPVFILEIRILEAEWKGPVSKP